MSHGACPYLAPCLTWHGACPRLYKLLDHGGALGACPPIRHRPNGAAHTSPGCNPGIGLLMNRMRSEGTPHHGRANGWSRVMRRSFRTRRSLVCHTRGCTPGWYAVPRWGTSNRLSKPLRACPHLQFNVPRSLSLSPPRSLSPGPTLSRPMAHGISPSLPRSLSPGPCRNAPIEPVPVFGTAPTGRRIPAQGVTLG
jgi:hypothetical protein